MLQLEDTGEGALKALSPRSPDQVMWRELRSMDALGEIKRK